MNCELCHEAIDFPSILTEDGRAFHVSCLVEEYDRLRERWRKAVNYGYVAGIYGPWAEAHAPFGAWNPLDDAFLGEEEQHGGDDSVKRSENLSP
jgi:hypothetical protein